jgi:excisionase family DNA binding protein
MPITLGDLRLYTVDEISEKLHVSRRTLYTYVKTGRLKAQKFGSVTYVSEDALREYFNPQKKTT